MSQTWNNFWRELTIIWSFSDLQIEAVLPLRTLKSLFLISLAIGIWEIPTPRKSRVRRAWAIKIWTPYASWTKLTGYEIDHYSWSSWTWNILGRNTEALFLPSRGMKFPGFFQCQLMSSLTSPKLLYQSRAILIQLMVELIPETREDKRETME